MKYDDEFKRQAVEKVLDGQSVRSVSRELGVTESQIHKWRRAAVSNVEIARFDGVYLFPQNDIDYKSATQPLNYFHFKTVRRLGFNFRLYDCRHTFATRALESG